MIVGPDPIGRTSTCAEHYGKQQEAMPRETAAGCEARVAGSKISKTIQTKNEELCILLDYRSTDRM